MMRPFAVRLHDRNHGLADQEWRPEVYGNDLIELLGWKFTKRSPYANRSVVHEDVDATESLHRRSDNPDRGIILQKVESAMGDLRWWRLLTALSCNLDQRLVTIVGGKENAGPLGAQLLCDFCTDPARSASHERDLVVQEHDGLPEM
jgi:hypothetical protein